MKKSKDSINDRIKGLESNVRYLDGSIDYWKNKHSKLKDSVNLFGTGFAIMIIHYVFIQTEMMTFENLGALTMAIIMLVLLFDLLKNLGRVFKHIFK